MRLPGIEDATPARPPLALGTPDPRLRVDAVAKRFGPVQALAGVDLDIAAGEVVALLGRNGAGKTTLIRVLCSSVIPDAGSVWIDGRDVLGEQRRARGGIGLVLSEDRSFFWRLTGRQNLEFFAALHDMGRRDAKAAAAAGLASVGLDEVADRRVDRYSTGMRSRLGIARALLGRPAVLLLDEPTRSLDPAAAAEVRALVRDQAERHGVAVLLATHDLHEAATLASRVVVLERGRVVARFPAGVSAAELEAAVTAEVR